MIYRKAKIDDVEQIYQLIMDYANEGLMLARPRQGIYAGIREYIVGENSTGEVVAIGALRILWSDLAEICSLAVREPYLKKGIGKKIVELLENEAEDLRIPQIFALTYQQGFFLKCGFNSVEHSALPQKVWRDCIDCPKFPDCDEKAVLKNTSHNG
ncbi:MAG: N-acetyltransferase [Clostridiales bacterium]